MAVAITRTELSAGELRAAAAKTTDAKAARRILAIALVMGGIDRRTVMGGIDRRTVMGGIDRRTAAECCGMDRQTLRGWGENVRDCLRANRLAISVFETYDEIVARCCDAWNLFASDVDTVRSITTRDYARTVKI